ncbi:hypothetical protein VCHA53O466_50298 [Vibrio chagasii]|nr:hypothetical protein VCHA53O466_50298 [Vibrio chagasii]
MMSDTGLTLSRSAHEALAEVGGYLNAIHTDRAHAVLEKDVECQCNFSCHCDSDSEEIAGYWQTAEYLQGCEELAERCHELALSLTPPEKLPESLTYASAESITGGRIQEFFTSLSGSSEYFMGGICAYSLESKVSTLSVDRELATNTNCVDMDVAIQMAEGCRRLFNADVSIATTGYVDDFMFNGARKDSIVYAAVSIKGAMYATSFTPTGDSREARLRYTTKEVIEWVRSLL